MFPNPCHGIISAGCGGPHSEAELDARTPLILFAERSDKAAVHDCVRARTIRALIGAALSTTAATAGTDSTSGPKLFPSCKVHAVGDRDFRLGILLQRLLDVHLQLVSGLA